MRTFALSNVKTGMTRLRDKGGASKDSLYDLHNAYVSASGSVVPRQGTRLAYTLPAGTKGLMSHKGRLLTFSNTVLTSPDANAIGIEVLTHPDNPALAIVDIWFAAPFLGFPYVVAEFADGSVYHYWLEEAETWQPDTVYNLGDLVQPTVPNGLVYRAGRLNPAGTTWAPDTATTVGDIVEPTTFNGYQFEAIDIIGDARTGTTEPSWNTGDGAITYEDVNVSTSVVTGGDAGGGGTVPADIQDRYSNPGGSRPGGTGTVAQ